jgi:two-component system, cell cycle sensor histidine kinase and response regulator CckA
MTSPLRPESHTPEAGLGQRSLELFEHAPVGLWEVDATGMVVTINRTLLQWLGYQPHDVVGRLTAEALVGPAGEPALRTLVERCRQTGQAEEVLLVWSPVDGRAPWPGVVTAGAVYNAEKQVIGWRGSVRDVTQDQSLLQRQLQERTMEAIERLASGVAHKFNNLLQVIQGYAELGLITIESAHPVHSHLSRIKEAAQRAAALVQGLVAFSRRQTLRRRPLDLQAFVEQMGDRLRRVVPAGVSLQVVPGAERVRVLADAARLEQVLVQLVVNACEAMPHGGEVAMETHVARDMLPPELPAGGYGCVIVRDSGIGMTSEVLEQVFEPFFTTKDSASGLGLAVVWGVVKQHGGHGEILSQPSGGTTARIYLPVEDEAS